MEAFFGPWISRLDELHSDLHVALNHRSHLVAPAVNALLVHYREYRNAKARLAGDDVLRALSHSWLTPFERTFLWVAGWKPSVALRLLPPPAAGGDNPRLLSPDQWRAVEELRQQVVAAEHCISEHLAGAQEAMAGHAVLAAVRGGARNGDARAAAADTVASALRAVVRAAEELRDATLGRVLAILTAAQAAEFLAAAAELRLRVHRWGLRRNARRISLEMTKEMHFVPSFQQILSTSTSNKPDLLHLPRSLPPPIGACLRSRRSHLTPRP